MSDAESSREARLRAIGEAIQVRRSTLGISQTACGELVGVAQEEISRIESGRHAIGVDRLWQIADALETTPAGLLIAAQEIEGDDEDD